MLEEFGHVTGESELDGSYSPDNSLAKPIDFKIAEAVKVLGEKSTLPPIADFLGLSPGGLRRIIGELQMTESNRVYTVAKVIRSCAHHCLIDRQLDGEGVYFNPEDETSYMNATRFYDTQPAEIREATNFKAFLRILRRGNPETLEVKDAQNRPSEAYAVPEMTEALTIVMKIASKRQALLTKHNGFYPDDELGMCANLSHIARCMQISYTAMMSRIKKVYGSKDNLPQTYGLDEKGDFGQVYQVKTIALCLKDIYQADYKIYNGVYTSNSGRRYVPVDELKRRHPDLDLTSTAIRLRLKRNLKTQDGDIISNAVHRYSGKKTTVFDLDKSRKVYADQLYYRNQHQEATSEIEDEFFGTILTLNRFIEKHEGRCSKSGFTIHILRARVKDRKLGRIRRRLPTRKIASAFYIEENLLSILEDHERENELEAA